jgi:hypothetical protein
MGRLTPRHRRHPAVAALLAALLLALLAAPVSAVVLYTVVVTPLSATQGSATNFSVTVSNLNLLDDLGCVQFDLPASFDILSLSTPVASNGEDWLISRLGQSVIAHSDDGGGRLELTESVSFVIRARPQAAGAFTWPNHGHRDQDCGGSDLVGSPVALTVLPGLEPTPLPTAVPTLPPTPKPLPTLLPTPKPTPRPTQVPTLLPTTQPTQRGHQSRPTAASATPSERERDGEASPRPSASAAAPRQSADDPGAPGGDAGSGPIGHRPFAMPPEVRMGGGAGDGGPVDLQLGPVGLLAGTGAWLVPAAVIGGPGLLVILFVVLQIAGALAWIPAVRRLRGEARPSR